MTDPDDFESLPTRTAPAVDPEHELSETYDSTPSCDDLPAEASLPGYVLRRKIGIGGMGEVMLAHDERLGRDVAIKRLKSASAAPATIQRFLREAKIQARLDHPAIVPVHSLGADARGQPYFVMKRLTGTTLSAHIKKRTKTRNELLRAFVDVCLAIDFAHERSVVHRDLKPGNIMLGEYGEVYVIDWGVARMLDEPEPVRSTDVRTADVAAQMTQEGALLGTPGYMAPEQVDGAADVGPAADIYSLGAILFEILTGAPLHPRNDAILSTLADRDPRPSHRAKDHAIDPELDELVVQALAATCEQRPTARQLADGVQRYLDGDRDVERRRAQSVVALASAQAALASGEIAARVDALRSAGRALALDPESREAAALVTRLMLEPPATPLPQLVAELAASEAAMQQRQGRAAVRSLLVVLVFLGTAALTGVRSAPLLLGITGWTMLVIAIAYAVSRRPARRGEMWVIAIGNALLASLLSRLFGPLIVAPVVACVMAVSLTSYPQLMRHARVVISILVLAWLGPVVLEYLGLFAPTWEVTDGAIVSTSQVLALSSGATSALLIFGNCLAIVVIGAFANALARSRREAQRSVEIQAWHLRQLLPIR